MSHEPLVNHFVEDSFNPNHVETTAVFTIHTVWKDLISVVKNKRIHHLMIINYFDIS